MRTTRAIILLVLVALLASACPVRTIRALGPPTRGSATVGFGYRTAPLRSCAPAQQAFWGTCLYHPQSAVDFKVPYGTPVRAMESGFVFMRDQEFDGEGDPSDPPPTTTTLPAPTTTAPPVTAPPTTLPPVATTGPPQTSTTLETVELDDIEPIAAYERKPGMFVVLDHRKARTGYNTPDFTRYSHLSSFSWATLGRWVKKGQIIGYAGNTQIPGGSTHVHVDAFYGLRDNSPTGGFNTYEHMANLGRFCWKDSSGRVHTPWASQFRTGQRVDFARAC